MKMPLSVQMARLHWLTTSRRGYSKVADLSADFRADLRIFKLAID